MRIPLAWLNLLHSKMRTALAVAGVAFAVILIFMQLGFLGSAEQSATLVFDALDFDLLIRSRNYLHLVASRTFPRDRLDEAESLPGVRSASPGLSRFRLLAQPARRQQAGDADHRRRSRRSAFSASTTSSRSWPC